MSRKVYYVVRFLNNKKYRIYCGYIEDFQTNSTEKYFNITIDGIELKNYCVFGKRRKARQYRDRMNWGG